MSVVWKSSDNRYCISTDVDLIQYQDIRHFLNSYEPWDQSTEEDWTIALGGSVAVFGVYDTETEVTKSTQIGFARLISDKTRLTWLADFFILPSHRGLGLGKALLHSVLDCIEFKLRYQMVNTRGSEELANFLKKYAAFKSASEDKIDETMYRFGRRTINPPLETDLIPHPTLQEYFASTNKDLLDIPVIHGRLITLWAFGDSIEDTKCKIVNSDCIGIYRKQRNEREPKQVGFARWITDCRTVAYMADVFIQEEDAGKGLGKWLVQQGLAMRGVETSLRPEVDNDAATLRQFFALRTRTAQKLYERYAGFKVITPDTRDELNVLIRKVDNDSKK